MQCESLCVCVSLSPEWDPLADSGNWSGEWRVQLYSDPYSHVPLLSVMVLVLSWHLPGLYVSTRHLWALNYFRNSHPQSICKDHTVPLWITPVLLRTNWSSCGLNWSLWGSHDPLDNQLLLVRITWPSWRSHLSSWGSTFVSFTKKLQPPNSRYVFLHILPCFGFGMTRWHSSHGCGHCVHGSGCDCALKRRGMQRVHQTEISSDPKPDPAPLHHMIRWLCQSHAMVLPTICDMSMCECLCPRWPIQCTGSRFPFRL